MSSEIKPIVVIIDENNFMWRAAGATMMSTLTNSKGKVTGHVFNYIRMLLQYWYQADAVIAVEDRRPKRKYELFPEYKSARKERIKTEGPNETFEMVKELQQISKLLPIVKAYCKDEEADDTMASVAQKFINLGYNVKIVTSDKDLWQMISSNTVVESTKQIDNTMMQKNFHIGIDKAYTHLVLAKALKGDPSDSIPPVASRMMSKDLERLINSSDGTVADLLTVCKLDTSTTAKKIIDNKDNLKRNYEICNLRKDLEVTYYQNVITKDQIVEKLTEYECATLLPKIDILFRSPENYSETTEGILE